MKSAVTLLVAFTLYSCGTMRARQENYFSVHNGTDANYYRLRVKAKSVLGDAEYRSGWYPSESVDMLFGDVSDESEAHYIKTRKEIKELINTAVKETYKMWLDSARQPGMNEDVLTQIMMARRRILAYPDAGPPFQDSYEIEFNVAKGIAIKHLDEKLVLILSSNPDEVVGKIVNFAESEKTAEVISMLTASVISQRNAGLQNELALTTRADTLILDQITRTLTSLKDVEIIEGTSEEHILVLINLLKQ